MNEIDFKMTQRANQSDPMQYVHIRDVRVGDTVEHNGHLRTVGRADLKRDTFMGTTLWGDSYRAGTVLVRKACSPSAGRSQ